MLGERQLRLCRGKGDGCEREPVNERCGDVALTKLAMVRGRADGSGYEPGKPAQRKIQFRVPGRLKQSELHLTADLGTLSRKSQCR